MIFTEWMIAQTQPNYLRMSQPHLILGIGNELLSDDGVGIHAIRLLEKNPPSNTTIVDGGTDFLSLIPYLEQCSKALVIDAMDAGGPPGTIYECSVNELTRPDHDYSLHELGLISIMEFIEPDRRPTIHILGIQPGRIAYGTDLSEPVGAVLLQVVTAARQIIADFGV